MTVDLELAVRESIYDAESARAGLERIKSLGVFPSKVDTTLRRLLLDICDSEDDSFKVLRKLLDFALNCSEKGFCGSELPLGLLEEAMDAQTISGCDELFGFLETHRQRMTARMGKGQALLRLCNELLRRLSKTEDTVFCGRILIFLSLVFPLSERSAVNLRGEFNTDNVTTYEQDLGEQMMTEHVTKNEEETLMSANSSEDLTKYSDGLYTTLWSLQGYLNNPMQLLAAPIVLANFHKSIAIVIEALQTIEQSMIKQSYSTASREPIQAQHSDLRAYFPPKFLTSRKLLPLELADLSFRRHILVQIMIVLDFLLGLTASSKEKWNSRGATTNKSLQIPYVLPVADAEWVSETRKRVLTIVEAGQDGVKFLIIVENALARDQDWLRWKCSGCPPYDLPPIEDKKILDAPKKVAALAAARKQYPHAVGNAVLSKLWASAGGWSDAELHNCSAYVILRHG